MDMYDGPATLVTEQGELPVEAHLIANRDEQHPGWGGVVTVDDPDHDLTATAKCERMSLRLGEDEEFSISACDVGLTTGSLRVSGKGLAPF